MVQVVEIEGDCSASGLWGYSCGGIYTEPWTVYAYTDCAYDVRDNLTVVYDANARDAQGALLDTRPTPRP
jgi:hypothetical protein